MSKINNKLFYAFLMSSAVISKGYSLEKPDIISLPKTSLEKSLQQIVDNEYATRQKVLQKTSSGLNLVNTQPFGTDNYYLVKQANESISRILSSSIDVIEEGGSNFFDWKKDSSGKVIGMKIDLRGKEPTEDELTKALLLVHSAEDIYMPSSFTDISANLLEGNKRIKTFYADGLKTMGDYAFGGSSLANLTIPDNLEEIGSSIFESMMMGGAAPIRNLNFIYKSLNKDNLVSVLNKVMPWSSYTMMYGDSAKYKTKVILGGTVANAQEFINDVLSINGANIDRREHSNLDLDLSNLQLNNLDGIEVGTTDYIFGVTLPKTITSVDSTKTAILFSKLKSISLPGVTTIGDNTFNNCTLATSFAIPDNATIGTDAFYDTTPTLLEIIAKTTPTPNVASNFTNVIGAGMVSPSTLKVSLDSSIIENDDININTYLSSVLTQAGSGITSNAIRFIDLNNTDIKTLPSSIDRNYNWLINLSDNYLHLLQSNNETTVPTTAYNNYKFDIKSITLSDGLTAISDSFAQSNQRLESIDIGGATTIGDYSFSNCANLKSINTENVTSIGTNSFSSCNNLKNIDLSSVQTIADSAFWGSGIETVDVGGATTIGNSSFYYCNNLKNIDLSSVQTIADNAFRSSGIETVILPESGGVSIGQDAFRDSKISNIDLSKVISIGGNAFWNATNLKLADLSNIQTINPDMFENSGVETVILPVTLTNLTERSFSDMKKLKTINTSHVTTLGQESIQKCYELESLDLSSVTSIGARALDDCKKLSSVTLGPVETIGENAFQNTVIESLTLPATYTTVNANTFAGMPSLTTLDLTGVTSITGKPFGDRFSSQLTTINLPAITSIAPVAFDERFSLTSVTLSDSLTSLPNEVFRICNSLPSLDFKNVTSIGEHCFTGCRSLKEITISDQVTSIHGAAFSDATGYSPDPSVAAPLETINVVSKNITTNNSGTALDGLLTKIYNGFPTAGGARNQIENNIKNIKVKFGQNVLDEESVSTGTLLNCVTSILSIDGTNSVITKALLNNATNPLVLDLSNTTWTAAELDGIAATVPNWKVILSDGTYATDGSGIWTLE